MPVSVGCVAVKGLLPAWVVVSVPARVAPGWSDKEVSQTLELR